MHIVIACWLYIFATVALTMKSGFAAAATFLFVGCGPVAIYMLLALRRLRRRRGESAGTAARSGFEYGVHERDDRDA
ncbi:MAG: hypothetical protein ABI190_02820 [Casimicrobiaceae bacterium]